MDAPLYNTKGTSAGKVTLPERVFGAPWNADLMHQVIVSMQANLRAGTAHAKDRSEVRGGGKKPWRQKGTGRARHGSSRSPIWVGGGVTHGPRKDKNYDKKINRSMKTKALAVALSRKLKDNEILFVDDISFSAPKTAAARALLTTLSKVEGFEAMEKKTKNATLVITPENAENTIKSFRNMGNVVVVAAASVNPLDLATYRFVVVSNPDAVNATLEKRVTPRGRRSVDESEAPVKKPAAKKAKAITTA